MWVVGPVVGPPHWKPISRDTRLKDGVGRDAEGCDDGDLLPLPVPAPFPVPP